MDSPASVVHAESEHGSRVVAFHQATMGEARFYFEQVTALGEAPVA